MERQDKSFDCIAIDPRICLGLPRVRGTRITVEFVLKLMRNGHDANDIVHDYPELTPDDVFQCASYGAWLASDRLISID